LGGKRAYQDRLGEDWSVGESRHSVAMAKWASTGGADIVRGFGGTPPEGTTQPCT
jgi:hypothetical protein